MFLMLHVALVLRPSKSYPGSDTVFFFDQSREFVLERSKRFPVRERLHW